MMKIQGHFFLFNWLLSIMVASHFVTLQTLVLLPGGVVSVAGRRPLKK